MNPVAGQKAQALLKSNHLRVTENRTAILSVLIQAHQPLTQEQIGDRLKTISPNKTTIYRALLDFVEHDMVHRAYINDTVWHFEMSCNCGQYCCHPHFNCLQCGRTFCLKLKDTPLVKLPKGFVMKRQQIRIDGLCAECQKKNT